ncbi:NAD(P)-dependent oxidoreductase [Frisingicoccus sp.]|uniref:NAD(P)-dependent oxidoreductase n=1 Tax=Frisingicoccus sp. TaxID=1918627 RepID=UPI003AB249D3
MMRKVFLCEYIHPEAYAYLKAHAEVIHDWDRLSEAEALIDRNLKITDEIMETAKSLRLIGIHGTGVDDVDMAAAGRRGIQVFSVPHQNSRSVAEMNVALMLALGRKIVRADRILRGQAGQSAVESTGSPESEMTDRMAELQGMELAGKTLGLIGVGDISRQTADICRKGFDMEVIGWSRSLTEEKARRMDMAYADSMAEVFQKADVIIVGVALTPETRHLIGREQFAQMNPKAMLINTTRGAVLDEQALYESLAKGEIGGAACDVFAEEPISAGHPLLALDNFVAAPHLGANTEEALRRVGMAVVQGVLNRLDGNL